MGVALAPTGEPVAAPKDPAAAAALDQSNFIYTYMYIYIYIYTELYT